MYLCTAETIKITSLTRQGHIAEQVRAELALTPTAEQSLCIDVFVRFVTDPDPTSLMIMRGSAGTGKTSLAAAIARASRRLGLRTVLLAPTGRAAKVFALAAGGEATTIHRRIYRQKIFAGGFELAPNMGAHTLFMVDEASMIANAGDRETVFAAGRLLDDLVSYVYGGRRCRMMLIGDKAQLPPVGEVASPALDADYMGGYGLKVFQCDMDEVVRQSALSGILANATAIRRMATADADVLLPRVRFNGFADVETVDGADLIESIASSYALVGQDETIVVTRSNKRANIYNNGIRASVLGCEDLITSGDILMIVKNNYYWAAQNFPVDNAPAVAEAAQGDGAGRLTFIANGDRAVVRRVKNVRELYGFHFADLLLTLPDYDDIEIVATAITDSLATEAPTLTVEQERQLFDAVAADYADITRKPERIKMIREDRHFNALQVKFAYAVTCHKAQGGQWAHVYLDQGYMTDDMLSADYIHWLYTAFTRATERLFLVNWPKEQIAVATE